MQQINLIEARLLPPPRMVSGARLAGLTIAGALAVLGHWSYERIALARALAAVPGADAAAQAAAPDTTEGVAAETSDELAVRREQVAQREALRNLLAAEPLPEHPAALLQAVVAALPPTLWLTELELARERSLRIAGGALDAAALDQFAARLGRVDSLRGMPVATVRLEPIAPGAAAEGDETAPRTRTGHGWRFVLASRSAEDAP